MKKYADILDRVMSLRGIANGDDRGRVRAVMNGGAIGVQAVLNWEQPGQGPGSGKGASGGLGVDRQLQPSELAPTIGESF